MDTVRAGLGEQRIYQRKVELALPWFYLLPVDGRFEGIGMHRFDGLPDFGQQGGPGAGVMTLAAEDQEGLAVD